ncbi:MAG: hypothetical protein P4L53_16980 [Candidatus Obscuribacterales bacterium]|nr:hypothetical protein [Candidatus Obscuribacterales bacterium]
MDDVNEWSELEQKLDTALEHNTSELHQIAEIYKRLGMTDQAKEIETLITHQKKIVPIVSTCRTTKQSRRAC